jgi:Zn-dependent peptidase ImmA (M78 family)
MDMREILGITSCFDFNIVKQITRLVGKPFKKVGALHLEIFEEERSSIAYVSFNPLTLHVHREIWEDAEIGEPKSRFILAHELGHIVMHGYYQQAYSEDEKARLTFVPPEESAEAQANWFAALFLAPDHMTMHCKNVTELCLQFNFPSDYASAKFNDSARYVPKYSGESCPKCNNFTLIRNGTCLTCDTCQATTDCS